MKKILFAALVFASLSVQAQVKDSSDYYRKEMYRVWKELHDSLRNSPRFKDLLNRQENHMRKHNNYVGFAIFFDMLHADFSKFNSGIATSGFTGLKPLSYGLGFGITSKSRFVMFDLNFARASFENTSKKPGEKIAFALANVFEVNLGFDVLKSKVISLYPYGGLSARLATLTYKNEGTLNPSFTNITDIAPGKTMNYYTSTKLGLHAGIGIDAVIATSKKTPSETILFAKAGINKPAGTDMFKNGSVKYDAGIKAAIGNLH